MKIFSHESPEYIWTNPNGACEYSKEMAEYQYIYAVGRTALEAKVLGCKVLKYDPRFPDTTMWKVLDTMEAVKILQEELDKAEREIMSGTREGGKKASLKNKQLHGEDFYQRIGRKGGKNGHTGGFASNPELAREAGRKGGKKSRRGKSKKTLKEAEGGESAKD